MKIANALNDWVRFATAWCVLVIVAITAAFLPSCTDAPTALESKESTAAALGREGETLLQVSVWIPDADYAAVAAAVVDAIDLAGGELDGPKSWRCCWDTGCTLTSGCGPELPPGCTCGGASVCLDCFCEPCQ